MSLRVFMIARDNAIINRMKQLVKDRDYTKFEVVNYCAFDGCKGSLSEFSGLIERRMSESDFYNPKQAYLDLAKAGKTDKLIEIVKRDLGLKRVSFQEVKETLVTVDDQIKDDPRIQFFLKFAENPFEARPVTVLGVPEQDCPDQVSFEDFIKDKSYCMENKTTFRKCVETYCTSYQKECLGKVFFYEDYVNEEAL